MIIFVVPAAQVSSHTVRWQLDAAVHQLQDEEAIEWTSRWSKAYTKSKSKCLVPSVMALYRRYSRTFPVAAPRIWNALQEETTSAQSLTSFRKHLKTWLFKLSYPELII